MQIAQGAFRVIRFLWASPCSLLGLIFALVALLGGASIRRYGGTLEVAGGRLGSWINALPSSMRLYAITLGHIIIGPSHDLLRCHRRHEHVHVEQYDRWGILLIPLYFASSLSQYCHGRDPYNENRFEREACTRNASMKEEGFL